MFSLFIREKVCAPHLLLDSLLTCHSSTLAKHAGHFCSGLSSVRPKPSHSAVIYMLKPPLTRPVRPEHLRPPKLGQWRYRNYQHYHTRVHSRRPRDRRVRDRSRASEGVHGPALAQLVLSPSPGDDMGECVPSPRGLTVLDVLMPSLQNRAGLSRARSSMLSFPS